MRIESKAGQIELRNRRSDHTSFVDSGAVEEVVRSIEDGMYKIRHRAGEVVYPFSLSRREVQSILRLVRKRSGNLVCRIGEITPIRLEEGIGTVISIKEKGRR